MSDLRELYQELVLDHGRNPRNLRKLEHPTAEAIGFNPLCGDRLKLFVRFHEDRVEDVSFEGGGCAISTASASLLTQALKNRSREEVQELIDRFLKMLTGSEKSSSEELDQLGKLVVFSGVREFPVRVKCATLAWRTLESAMKTPGVEVSTE